MGRSAMAYGDAPAARHLRYFPVASQRANVSKGPEPDPAVNSATSMSLRPDPKYSLKRRVAFGVAVLVGAVGIAALTILILYG